ncbi:MAG: nucleotidyltransferase domain-containing protein, partial [Tannerellaceae bacterium]|nr:nucleotidyltransferase domain-containing protein [Tannerellaceae bacterium]
YACESGSRAWGFPSPDSDYDVRFIYVRPQNEYLNINEPNDIIELPVNDVFDIGGWDLRKALRLFAKSNAVLFEWLQSPIIYKQDTRFVDELKRLVTDYFSLKMGANHYLGITKGAWKEMQINEVRLKKYFYCLRPILAALWIIEKREIPPMEFSRLRTLMMDSEWQSTVDELLRIKSGANEKMLIQPVPLLQTFIETQINYCEAHLPDANQEIRSIEKLNVLFREQLHDI